MEFLELLFGWIGDYHLGWSLIPILVNLRYFSITNHGTVRADRILWPHVPRPVEQNNADDSNQISAREAAGWYRSADVRRWEHRQVGGGDSLGVPGCCLLGMWAIRCRHGPPALSNVRLPAVQTQRKNSESTLTAASAGARSSTGWAKEYAGWPWLRDLPDCRLWPRALNAFRATRSLGSMKDSFA